MMVKKVESSGMSKFTIFIPSIHDFFIDVPYEHELLLEYDVIVFQHHSVLCIPVLHC